MLDYGQVPLTSIQIAVKREISKGNFDLYLGNIRKKMDTFRATLYRFTVKAKRSSKSNFKHINIISLALI